MIGECCSVTLLDHEEPVVFCGSIVTARKPHVCTECYETIRPGDQYERADGLWGGEWSHFKTCWFCQRVREDFFPDGFLFGELVRSFQECQGWDYREIPEGED